MPEAEDLVGEWRAVHDPKAATGVPAHITLVVPWIPPDEIGASHLEQLDRLLAGREPIEYLLSGVSWFGDRVLWLAPSPAEPFKALTSLLAGYFGTPPWRGEFDEVVPHLTVGMAGHACGQSLSDVEASLSAELPVKCRATEVDVMCGDGERWEVVHRSWLAR